MRTKLLIPILLFCLAGCSKPDNILYNLDPDKMFRIPPNANIEWKDMKLSELPKGMGNRPSTRDVPIVKGEIVGDVRKTQTWGWFVDDEIMELVYKIKAEEDLRKTWSDDFWTWLGL